VYYILIYIGNENGQNCPDKTARPGIIAVLQTAGSRLNINIHIHLLITEGLLSERTTDTGEPITYPLPLVHYRYMNLLWRNKVLLLLKNMKVISQSTMIRYKQKFVNGFYWRRLIWKIYFDGLIIYTKGKILKYKQKEVFYVIISSKKSTD